MTSSKLSIPYYFKTGAKSDSELRHVSWWDTSQTPVSSAAGACAEMIMSFSMRNYIHCDIETNLPPAEWPAYVYIVSLQVCFTKCWSCYCIPYDCSGENIGAAGHVVSSAVCGRPERRQQYHTTDSEVTDGTRDSGTYTHGCIVLLTIGLLAPLTNIFPTCLGGDTRLGNIERWRSSSISCMLSFC